MFFAAKKKEPQSVATEADRRVYPRYPSVLETSCQPIGSGSSWKALVKDLSQGGVGLVLSRHFKPGTLLQMQLENDEINVSRSVLARVVHAHQQADGNWHIGCAFSSELDNEELQAFCIQRVEGKEGECRAWVRFTCDLSTTCQARDSGENWPVRIVNIAPGGVGLQSAFSMQDGAFLELEIPSERGNRQVLIRVVYKERTKDGWFVGCEFAKRLTDDEIYGLVG